MDFSTQSMRAEMLVRRCSANPLRRVRGEPQQTTRLARASSSWLAKKNDSQSRPLLEGNCHPNASCNFEKVRATLVHLTLKTREREFKNEPNYGLTRFRFLTRFPVGITAGASCPNNLIENAIRRLFELRGISVRELLAN
jgi:hypothetical protein